MQQRLTWIVVMDIFIRTIEISISPNLKYMQKVFKIKAKQPSAGWKRNKILRLVSKLTQNNHQTTACGGNTGGNTINQGLTYENKRISRLKPHLHRYHQPCFYRGKTERCLST